MKRLSLMSWRQPWRINRDFPGWFLYVEMRVMSNGDMMVYMAAFINFALGII